MSYPRREPKPVLKHAWWQELANTPLAGSEKQVVWATDIRLRKLAQLEAIKPAELAHLLKLKGFTDDDFDRCGADTIAKMASLLERVKLHAASSTSAKWWIDRRDEEIRTWLSDAAEFIFDHYSEHPPQWTTP